MRFWNFRAVKADGSEGAPGAGEIADGELDIEGPICEEAWFDDETGSREFRRALRGVRNVTVHINSPGGDVMAGAEIYSALREHSMNGLGKVNVIITALAASAASVIAMAGDEILISPVAYMMIHNPWSIAMGDAREMRKTARTLDEITEGLITAYQLRTGKTRDQLKRMLENETWMSAQTCVEEGFADGVWNGEIKAAAMAGAGTLTRATPEKIAEMCARWEASRSRKEPEEPDLMAGVVAGPGEGDEGRGIDSAESATTTIEQTASRITLATIPMRVDVTSATGPSEPAQATDNDRAARAPEADDPEDPEDPEEPEEEKEPEEEAKRAEARARAAAAAAAAEAWEGSFFRAEEGGKA